MTLAHELGHLILDREGGLPFCDVLGGEVDDFMERRAYAFAAELLLPRAVVEEMRSSKKGAIGDFVAALRETFGVSKAVVHAQLHNSAVFATLSAEERRYLEKRLGADHYGGSHAIRIRAGSNVT